MLNLLGIVQLKVMFDEKIASYQHKSDIHCNSYILVDFTTSTVWTNKSVNWVRLIFIIQLFVRTSDPWLQPERDRDQINRRRSSTMTARYSLFDALDLEYALLRAAARGSVGPYSLSESLHKLTFTQSLAFPALARGLATKRRRSAQQSSSRPLNPHESGLNTFAKVITAIVLVVVSFLVFLIVYKFVQTWGLLLAPTTAIASQSIPSDLTIPSSSFASSSFSLPSDNTAPGSPSSIYFPSMQSNAGFNYRRFRKMFKIDFDDNASWFAFIYWNAELRIKTFWVNRKISTLL